MAVEQPTEARQSMSSHDLEKHDHDVTVTEHGAKNTTSPSEQQDEKLNFTTLMACVALACQFNAYIMTLLIPSTTLAYIVADLPPNPSYAWITVSWQLGASILVSIGGRLSDIFGRRYFMLCGAFFGIVGCVVGATGQSINQMIASGAIFGVASGFQEMAYACLQEILPNKYRMIGIGFFDLTLCWAFMSPVISFAFIAYQPISWRGAYWLMFSWHSFAAIILFLFYYPPDFYMKHRADGKTKLQLLKEMDYVGILLFTSAGTLFLVGVNFGGRQYPWSSSKVIAPIVVGCCCYIALGFYETRPHLKYPLLPPRLFREIRGFVMVLVVCFVGGMLYYSMNVLWPRMSQIFFVPATQPILRGVYATIFSYGTLLGGAIMVLICSRVGHERWQIVTFMCLQTALIGSLASVGLKDKAQAIVTIIFGSATVTPPQLVSFTMLSLNLEDQNDIGIAVGLAGTFRLLGGAIATAIYSAVLSGRFASTLPAYVRQAAEDSGFPMENLPALLKATATNTAAAYKKVPGITQAVMSAAGLAYKLAYVQAFRLVFLIAIGFGGAAIVAAFCTKTTPVSLKNNNRAVRLKNELGIDGQAMPAEVLTSTTEKSDIRVRQL